MIEAYLGLYACQLLGLHYLFIGRTAHLISNLSGFFPISVWDLSYLIGPTTSSPAFRIRFPSNFDTAWMIVLVFDTCSPSFPFCPQSIVSLIFLACNIRILLYSRCDQIELYHTRGAWTALVSFGASKCITTPLFSYHFQIFSKKCCVALRHLMFIMRLHKCTSSNEFFNEDIKPDGSCGRDV